jgi:hypothetical protein
LYGNRHSGGICYAGPVKLLRVDPSFMIQFPFRATTIRCLHALASYEPVPFMVMFFSRCRVPPRILIRPCISVLVLPRATLINLTLISVALGASSFYYANTTLK